MLAPGVSNYWLLLGDDRPRVLLWFLDSGGGSCPEQLPKPTMKWLAREAASLRATHGELPALTFVHIPPPEYLAARAAGGDSCLGLAEDAVTPTKGRNALVKTLEAAGGARAVFVGHDHGNAWCCPYSSLHLCFGRHSGYGGYGDWARGGRVVRLSLDPASKGGVAVRTWVHLEDGSVSDEQWL